MHGRTAYPNRKISETFLISQRPSLMISPAMHLNTEPGKHCRCASRPGMQWSSQMYSTTVSISTRFGASRLTIPKPPYSWKQLIARKRALFADDERLIGSWEVTRTEDGINLRADARDPHSLPRDPR